MFKRWGSYWTSPPPMRAFLGEVFIPSGTLMLCSPRLDIGLLSEFCRARCGLRGMLFFASMATKQSIECVASVGLKVPPKPWGPDCLISGLGLPFIADLRRFSTPPRFGICHLTVDAGWCVSDHRRSRASPCPFPSHFMGQLPTTYHQTHLGLSVTSTGEISFYKRLLLAQNLGPKRLKEEG